MSSLLRITQIKSTINRPERHKRIIRALGFRRLNMTVSHADTPQIRGMIQKVRHLVRVEEIEGEGT